MSTLEHANMCKTLQIAPCTKILSFMSSNLEYAEKRKRRPTVIYFKSNFWKYNKW